LEVSAGETLAVVGESGSGKSTLLRAIAGLHVPDEGRIAFHGRALPARAVKRARGIRKAIQIVFQNPDSSLNPRHKVGRILERPLVLFRPDLDRLGRRERILELLADVRLDGTVLHRYPVQLSGGQKQRIALARAFAVEPEVILCDEVVSSLDVSVQASILELLAGLARDRHVALLFVTHDLAVVRSIADRVCVMRDGHVRESADTKRIFGSPEDAYTRELLAAVPRPDAIGAGGSS
jgi:peptide/nickel transport system ATP-binding protein